MVRGYWKSNCSNRCRLQCMIAWFKENEFRCYLYSNSCKLKIVLEEAIDSLKRLGCSGWNVTVPHKSSDYPVFRSNRIYRQNYECCKYCSSTIRRFASSDKIQTEKDLSVRLKKRLETM